MADMFESDIAELVPAETSSATITPTPAAQPDVQFGTAEDGSLVWGEEGGYTRPDVQNAPVEGEQQSLFPGLSNEDVFDFNKPTPQEQQQYQPQPAQQQYSRPAPEAMPASYDPMLTNPDGLKLREGEVRSFFDRELMNVARALGPAYNDPTVQSVVNGLMQAAAAGSVAAIRMKAEYSTMAEVAYNLHNQSQVAAQRAAPYDRIRTAQMVAEKYGVDDYRKLLKHPRLGTPVTNGKDMIYLASIIGEGQRQTRVAARQGIDNPIQTTGGRGGGRSLANLDPDSKEFEAILKQSLSGKTVRVAS